jgi:hypothetical protein
VCNASVLLCIDFRFQMVDHETLNNPAQKHRESCELCEIASVRRIEGMAV